MNDWLEQLLPAGPWQALAIRAAAFAVNVLVAVVLFLVARWLLRRGLSRVLNPVVTRAAGADPGRAARLRTLEGLTKSTLNVVLIFMLVLFLLNNAGVDIATLLAGAGVVGLAVSFGAQKLVKDVLTGFFILLEDQFRVGETVTLHGIPGGSLTGVEVLEMGLRVTHLRDEAGKLIIVSNGDIAAVVNHSRGPITASVEVGLAPVTDLDRAREALRGMRLPESVFAGPAALRGVTALDASKMTVRITAPARPGEAPAAEMALRREAAQALRAAGLELR